MAKTLDEAGVKRLIQEIKGANKNLNTPIPISTENTAESMAQNVKNIADYVEKAKAAGIDTTKSFRLTLEIDGYPVEGSYDIQYSYACGLQITDDGYALLYNIDVTTGEVFTPCEIVTAHSIQKVTSDMLAKGARNPIIFTESTTEVDEETYRKLEEMADATDVVFRTDSFEFMPLIAKDMGNEIRLIFGYTLCDASNLSVQNSTCSYVVITVETASPYKVTIDKSQASLETILNTSGYLNKSTLIPVLQEIDLTGTDAERKAKLDQFEADWKALTDASDLTGARFVGHISTPSGNSSMIFTWDDAFPCYTGIGFDDTHKDYNCMVQSDGSLTITPLFSHLEAITIYTDNTPEHKQANLDNIAAYEANLQALGVDTNNNHIIPIKFDEVDDEMGTSFPFGGFITTYGGYEGFITSTLAEDYKPRHIWISQAYGDEGKVTLEELAYNSELDNYTLKSLNAKSLEAITIKTDNKPESKAANVSAIKAYVDNLTALGVDTTKGYMIPAKIASEALDGFVSYHSDTADYPWSGIFIRPGGSGKFVGIKKDGFVTLIDDILISGNIYTTLTTTSKGIIPAINEINANAVHSDKLVPTFEAITIKTGSDTPEDRAATKAAIEAYRDNLTALGVDTTKGFMIPIKTNNGNGFILFDGTKGEGYIKVNNDCYGILITQNYGVTINNIMSASTYYGSLETTSKRVLSAINEVNALAKGYSTIFTPIELTTETAQNKTAIDARVAAFTAQGISLTNGCCIPVTYKGVYAGNISLINGDWYGLLVKNTNNPADNINIKLSADGTITEGNSVQ